MAAKGAGHLAGETVGGGLGFLAGHPIAGAWMGDKVLTPLFTTLAQPFAEKTLNINAAKASTEYLGGVMKGQKLLKEATKNFFKGGAKVLMPEMLPTKDGKEKLEKAIEHASNMDNMFNVGKDLAHYLPQHQIAAAEMASRSIEYLKTLKPKQLNGLPLDPEMPISKAQQAKYAQESQIKLERQQGFQQEGQDGQQVDQRMARPEMRPARRRPPARRSW